MVGSVNSNVSSLQILRATQAFKSAIKSSPKLSSAINESDVDEIQDRVSLSSGNVNSKSTTEINSAQSVNPVSAQKRQYADEVKQFANKYGNSELSDEDIDYALRFGRSVLVDKFV